MKGPEAFRTISEAAAELGVPQHVLRFWETKFSFIRPMKRAGGRRFYRRQDLEVLKGVRTLLHDEGYTIKGVQRLHKEQGVRRLLEAGGAPEGFEPAPDEAPEAAEGAAAPPSAFETAFLASDEEELLPLEAADAFDGPEETPEPPEPPEPAAVRPALFLLPPEDAPVRPPARDADAKASLEILRASARPQPRTPSDVPLDLFEEVPPPRLILDDRARTRLTEILKDLEGVKARLDHLISGG